MTYLYIGEVRKTHGLKGELCLYSDLDHKEDIFKINNIFYINNEPLTVASYRPHQNYDMVTFKDHSQIEAVLKYRGQAVYMLRTDLKTPLFVTELIDFICISDKVIGKVSDLIMTKKYTILVLDNGKMIPNIKAFVQKIDIANKTIYIDKDMLL